MLRYRTWNAVAWIIAVVMVILTMPTPSSAGPPWYTETIQQDVVVSRLAVDSNGVPHTAFWDFANQFLFYAKRVDGVWITEVVEATAFVGTEVSIAVDANNVPYIAFHNFTGSGIDELRYAVRTGPNAWTVTNVDPTGNDVGRYNAIRIDSQGRPHVCYYNETLQTLKYAVKNGGVWAIETADATPGSGKYADMVLDSSDRPHIVYYQEGAGIVKYRAKIGGVWFQDVTAGTNLADNNGIALDPAGNPILMTNNGGYMTIHTHDKGYFSSIFADTPTDIDGAIAVANDGTIHAFWQDYDTNDLWYVKLDGGLYSESAAVVDGATLDIGDKCDIAIDPYGNPLGVFYNATTGDAMFIDSGVRLSTQLSAVVWPVGAERTVKWRGAGLVSLLLSTNGGASYQTLARNLTGGASPGGGQYTFTVPHQPSHFCKLKIERTVPYSASLSDALFTIQGSVSLLNFTVELPGDGGASLTWSTNPGPEDLAGYRVERRREQGAWSTIVAMTKETSVRDAGGRGGDEYRLFSVNGLGEEMLLGTQSSDRSPALTALDVFPNPFSAGNLTVDFATAGGLGGGAGHATVAVYDVGGRLVHKIADRSYAAGMQRVTWNGRTARGEAVPSGVYFIRATTGAGTHTKKVLIVR